MGMNVIDSAHEIEVKPGLIIKVLKPKIDAISLTCNGKKALDVIAKFNNDKYKAVAHDYWKGFYARAILEAMSPDHDLVEFAGKRTPGYGFSVVLKLKSSGALVKLSGKPVGHRAAIRMEYNPSHFDKKSIKDLLAVWWMIYLGNVPLPALLVDARMTRLDVAVDVLNVKPYDLLVYHKKIWKIWSASSYPHGVETLNYYLQSGHHKSPLLSPKKRSNLIVYNKKKELIANGKYPEYGDLEHTRIEWSLTKNMPLSNLAKMPYPFSNWEIRRTIVEESPLPGGLWQLLLDSARFRGFGAAGKLIPKESWLKGITKIPENYLPKDVVTQSLWQYWDEAIKNAHLQDMVKWAKVDPKELINTYSEYEML